MEFRKTTLFILGIIILGVLGFFFFGSSPSSNGNVVVGNEDAQQVTLGFKDGNYYPQTITVQAGTPVELTIDGSVTGCFRSFNVKALNIQEYSKDPSEPVRFTPTKPGTYRFVCGMGMGSGILLVK
ncbi:hypothetical protein EXS73_00210 [Candidatus Pacearchaeota archaeon]|nr:hypothetical protein [Candidatus Pacearchaeota archaeon]